MENALMNNSSSNNPFKITSKSIHIKFYLLTRYRSEARKTSRTT